MVEMAMFTVQRAIPVIPKVGKPELQFVFCTSSHSASHLCEVSLKYHGWYQSYGVDTNNRSADGQMDTQNFRGYNIIPLPLFVARHKT